MSDKGYWQDVIGKEGDCKELFKRMDDDRDLVNLASYVLKDVRDKKLPNAVSVTLNDPAVFATNVESSLSGASEQVCVESEDKNVDTTYIEDLVRASLAEASALQIRKGKWALNPFLDQQACRRGRLAARCLFRVEKGILIPDITPWDTRYVTYHIGADGLKWAAYKATQSKDDIESQAWAQEIKFTISGKTAVVLDVWDAEKNEIWVDSKKVYAQANPYGYPPVVIQLVPLGSMLADKDSVKYQGESIFFLIRDLIPELNRLVSIIQSLNMKALDAALQWKSTAGQEATPPDHDELTKPGSTTAADMGGGAEPVPYGELRRSAWLLHSMIETRIQRGSLSNFDYGTFTQPMSAVALIQVGEGRDQVFLPRLGARGMLSQQLADMIIDQIIQSKESKVEIGTRGHKRSFNVSKLKAEFEIIFKYFVKSPKIDIARYQMAISAGNLIPDKAKRRDILLREDSEEDERQLRWEEAERLSPAVKIDRTIRALLEEADRGDKIARFEAELMSAEMGMSLKQLLAGETQQIPKPEEAQEPQPIMPLFGKSAGKSSAQKAADLEATPRAQEGEK